MRRRERRLFRLTDDLQRLRRDLELTAGELEMHRYLDEDARSDAAVSGSPLDRADAYQASKDVQRLAAAQEALRQRIARLEEERERLLSDLGS